LLGFVGISVADTARAETRPKIAKYTFFIIFFGLIKK
jgi:hypothetical protein